MDTEFALPREWRAKLWEQPPVIWETIVKQAPRLKANAGNIRRVTQGQVEKISMPCFHPSHQTTHPSAAIMLSDGYAKCLGGSCHAHTADPVELVTWLYNIDHQQALQLLLTQFKLKAPADLTKRMAEVERTQRMLTAFHNAAQATLVSAAASPTRAEHAPFLPAITYLQSRQIAPADAAQFGIGVFPPYDTYYNLLSAEDRPFADKVFNADFVYGGSAGAANRVTPYLGWLVFQYEYALGKFGKFKIRDVNPASGTHKQHRWFGPNTRDNFFGLGAFRAVYGDALSAGGPGFDILVVEGEFDAYAAIQYQLAVHGALRLPVVAGSGGGVGDVSHLLDTGATRIVLVPDCDAGGVGFVTHALGKLANADAVVVYEYDRASLDPALFDPTDPEKGPDPYDILLRGDPVKARAYFDSFDALSPAIIAAHEWLGNRFEDAHAQLVNPTAAQQLEVVKTYSKYLQQGVGADVFLQRISRITGFASSSLRALALQVATDEQSFRQLLELRLLEEFTPLLRHGNVMQCYSHNSGSTFTLRFGTLNEACCDLVSQALMRPVLEWVHDAIGVPDFISEMATKAGARPRPYGDQVDVVRRHMHAVITDQLLANTPVQDKVYALKQGVHAIRDAGFEDTSPSQQPGFYAHIINGNVHMRGRIEPGAEHHVDWHVFEDAMPYTSSVFVIGGEDRWSDFLGTDGFVGRPVPYADGVDALEAITEFFRAGWSFDDQEHVPRLLAAHALTAIIHQFADACPTLHFTGKTQAGKTSLTKGVLRGEIFDQHLWLTEHYTGIDAYTSAAVWQSMEGDARLMCLDEFEDSDDGRHSRKRHAVMAIYEDLRNVNTGMKLIRGGANGVKKVYYLRTGLITAGINPIKREVDANRYLTIRLNRLDTTPFDRLSPLYTPEAVKQLRQVCSVFALKHANGILGHYNALKADLKGRISVREDRVLHSIYLPLALLSYLGDDVTAIAQAIVTMHEDTLERTVQTEDGALFSAVFDTPALNLGDEVGVRRSLRYYLSDTQRRPQLNAYGLGAYVVGGDVYLHLPTLHMSVLRYHEVYKKTENPLTLHDRMLGVPEAEEVEDVAGDPALVAALRAHLDLRPSARTRLIRFPLSLFL